MSEELRTTDSSISIKRNLLAFDGLLQLILINVAVADGMFMKAEKEFIAQFCDYCDVMQLSGFSWDVLLLLKSSDLKNLIAGINAKIMDNLTEAFSIYYDFYDKIEALEDEVSNICHCLAYIDGDTFESPDYLNEMDAGMQLFEKAFKPNISFIPPSQTTWYGFNQDYETNDISIKIRRVLFYPLTETCLLSFSIHNKQHKKVRVWVKDIGVWSSNYMDFEECNDYKLLANIDSYDGDVFFCTIKDDLFDKVYLTPDCISHITNNNPYDVGQCCSELVFSITYDFGDTDVAVSHWSVDSIEFDIINVKNNDHTNESSHQDEINFSNWSVESVLKQAGYTVAQKEALIDSERQNILRNVIKNNTMSKRQVADHIEWQINLKKNNHKYAIAIAKWKRDLEFLKTL